MRLTVLLFSLNGTEDVPYFSPFLMTLFKLVGNIEEPLFLSLDLSFFFCSYTSL